MAMASDVVAQKETGLSVVEGYVLDDESGDGLPAVNIFFKNTTAGTISDFEGKYKIKSRHHNDTLIFRMMGYDEVKVYVEPGKKYRLIIRLKEDSQLLDEVVITPGENPAHPILRAIIANKDKNDPERFHRFNAQTYTTLAAKLTNVTKENLKLIIPAPLIKNLPVVTEEDGRKVLPFFLSEKIADNFIDKDNKISQTIEKDKKVKSIMGFDKLDISGYDNSLSAEMNFYKNYVELFGHTFISPLANNGLTFYRYYLEDSTIVDGKKHYTIKYVPRREKDLAFIGHFTAIEGIWAISKIDATLTRKANINYLNTFQVAFDYDFVNDSTLFFKSNTLQASFHYLKIKDKANNAMIEVDKMTLYTNIFLGPNASPLKEVEKKGNRTAKAMSIDSSFADYRAVSGKNNFSTTAETIDSTNNVWWIKGAGKLTNMFMTGYLTMGKIDFGPYLGTFSTNGIEGTRLNLGLRTSENFNPYYSVGGSLGYGFEDKEWKYSLYGQYKFNAKNRTILGAGLVKDLYLFGVFSHINLIKENMRSTGEDSFIAALFKRYHSDRRAMLTRYDLYLEKEWRRGFMTKLSYEYDELRQGVYVSFIHNGEPVNYIYNNSISLRLRFSWKEHTSDIFLRRYYLSTFYPVINILGTVGQYSVAGESKNYYKIHLTLKHRIPIGFMQMNYVFETGYIFGKVPFPLLNIIRGNDTYGDSRYRFNMLNNATAALDKYASVMMEHHFNGLLINKVPLLRNLNIRTVFSAKYFIGNLSNKHQQVLEYPWDMDVPGKHYLEVGAGLENILQLFRVEFIYRPVPKVYPDMPKYGVRVRMDFSM